MRLHSLAWCEDTERRIAASTAARHFHRADSRGRRWFFTEATRAWFLRADAAGPDRELAKLVRSAEPAELSAAEEHAAHSRLHYSIEAYLQDPPSPLTLLEAAVFLWTHPAASIEYLGRGDLAARPTIDGTPDAPGEVFVLDIAGGRRRYLWRSHAADASFADPDPRETFAALRAWFEEPGSRVVLSLGSGGMRMFGMTAVLKILDMIGLRDAIDEVWGCSGGAIMGLPYAEGVAPHRIEQVGYDYYNQKHPELVLGKTTWNALLRHVGRRLAALPRPTAGLIDVQRVLMTAVADALARRSPHLRRIPFYAIASNTTRRRIHALARPEDVPTHSPELILPCDPLHAVAASAAIPFLFPAQEIVIGENRRESFVDGMLTERTPYFLPLIKWHRDAERDPRGTPPRLKIFSVEVSSGAAEDEPPVRRGRFQESFAYAAKLLELALDSRRQLLLGMVPHLGNVEVLAVRFPVMRGASLSVKAIPAIIQQGRTAFFAEITRLNGELASRRNGSTAREAGAESSRTSAGSSG